MLFLLGLWVFERLLDDGILLLEFWGLSPRATLWVLLSRWVLALGLSAGSSWLGIQVLRGCLQEHGHLPGSCPDLAEVPHLCFEMLLSLGEFRGAPLGLWLLGILGLTLALGLRFLGKSRSNPRAREVFALPGMSRQVVLERDPDSRSGCRVEGLWAPRIVVPEDFEARFPEAEQVAALLHEVGHIEGRDPWIFQLGRCYRNLFFWLPGPRRWFAKLHQTLEERADAWAISQGASSQSLARSIARSAGVDVARSRLGLSGQSAELLWQRIQKIQGQPLPAPRFPWTACLRLGWAGLLLATGWVRLHCLVEALA